MQNPNFPLKKGEEEYYHQQLSIKHFLCNITVSKILHASFGFNLFWAGGYDSISIQVGLH